MDYIMEESTLVENPVTITEAGVRKLAKAAKGKIVKIYLHWTAGHYGHDYRDYHLCVDKDGTVYVNCDALTEKRCHTWLRNEGSIGVALCCAADARCWCPVAVSPRRVKRAAPEGEAAGDCQARIDFGDEPPTEKQIDTMAKLVAILCKELGLPVSMDTVITHCEIAFKDGYGPGGSDPDMRWDLWFLPDDARQGELAPGGEVIRGKALFYQEEMKRRYGKAQGAVA